MGLAGAKQNNLRVQHTAVHGRTVLIVARGTYEQKTHLYIYVCLHVSWICVDRYRYTPVLFCFLFLFLIITFTFQLNS